MALQMKMHAGILFGCVIFHLAHGGLAALDDIQAMLQGSLKVDQQGTTHHHEHVASPVMNSVSHSEVHESKVIGKDGFKTAKDASSLKVDQQGEDTMQHRQHVASPVMNSVLHSEVHESKVTGKDGFRTAKDASSLKVDQQGEDTMQHRQHVVTPVMNSVSHFEVDEGKVIGKDNFKTANDSSIDEPNTSN